MAADQDGVEVDPSRLAKDLGLGDGLGRNSAITRTLGRLCQFDLTAWAGDELAVRTVVAPVSERQLRRLSPEIAQVHHWSIRCEGRYGRARVGSTSACNEPSTEMGMSL